MLLSRLENIMRIGIISDIHANLVALEKVMQVMGTVERLWCLGDVVGYGPNPNECIEFLLAQPHLEICLTGNHDYAVIGKLELADFNTDARLAVQWTREQLSEKHFQFLRERPDMVRMNDEFTLAHASPRHPIWEYITSAAIARPNFAHFSTPICLVGHTHVPIVYTQDGEQGVYEQLATDGLIVNLRTGFRFIVNPGSVGQPRDENPRASYAIWDTLKGLFEFHRVEYDIALTQARMRAAGLPPRLAARLNYGW
jgi:diadenosine tetraphosphatase ApaH/serine/threonine PP2A family protein phosphatase